MEWSKGYRATYYMAQVDPATWRNIGVIRITGGSIKRELTGLRESADVDCTKYEDGVEKWVRIYMDVTQDGDDRHIAMFTGVASSPKRNTDGMIIRKPVACYSVLKPADDIILQRGWYAPAGISGGDTIKRLLAVTPAPVIVDEGAPALKSAIIAEDNETNLSMVERILTAINWRIKIAGDGTIRVCPQGATPIVTLDPVYNDVIETEISVTEDWYACPNVYMAVSGDMTGIARDDSPDSPLSTINRGREVWKVDTSAKLAANESVAEYALRQLKEAQKVKKIASYTRRYLPDVIPGDMITLHYPEQGLDGQFSVISQSISLGHNASTSEQVSMI
jgi:hypothetical protein